jgi:hypothetical protein
MRLADGHRYGMAIVTAWWNFALEGTTELSQCTSDRRVFVLPRPTPGREPHRAEPLVTASRNTHLDILYELWQIAVD